MSVWKTQDQSIGTVTNGDQSEPLRGNSGNDSTEVYVCVCVFSLGHVQLFVTPWTVAHQALLSMACSRQEDWGGLPLPSPWDLPTQGRNLGFL